MSIWAFYKAFDEGPLRGPFFSKYLGQIPAKGMSEEEFKAWEAQADLRIIGIKGTGRLSPNTAGERPRNAVEDYNGLTVELDLDWSVTSGGHGTRIVRKTWRTLYQDTLSKVTEEGCICEGAIEDEAMDLISYREDPVDCDTIDIDLEYTDLPTYEYTDAVDSVRSEVLRLLGR